MITRNRKLKIDKTFEGREEQNIFLTFRCAGEVKTDSVESSKKRIQLSYLVV